MYMYSCSLCEAFQISIHFIGINWKKKYLKSCKLDLDTWEGGGGRGDGSTQSFLGSSPYHIPTVEKQHLFLVG